MFIWQGAGILSILVPVILGILAQWSVDSYFGHGYSEIHSWQNAIAWTLGAVVIWLSGTKLAKRPTKSLIDPKTGAQVSFQEKHTLFWIPMQYWAIVWIGASIVSLVK